ncbi:peptidoglycan bridge formation glycyltransferase FemA/FemB family protein [Kocuria sp.]|uniref:lipid II:glycine glycyltransferase FemX n=1 Tax=Kocuria sp. TaxID=1871328 RepID=UPI0026DC0F97|nr:peptidoglycan bridge formation glycyltransferase FemA/FemB family protein [Kocuria sp.]MDO4919179.1 peptidoglycan bridge formation glycyltransferase FemA/FemB family protein [Kocuria sp.]
MIRPATPAAAPLPGSASSPLLGPASILQSAAWQEFQRSLGRTVLRRDGAGWQALVVEERTAVGPIWYAPYGPVLEHPSALPEALSSLGSAAREHGISWLRVEPQCPPRLGATFSDTVRRQNATAASLSAGLRSLGARSAPRDIQPAFTRWVDLTRPPEEILKAMTGTNRNLWRRHRDKGITIASSHRADAAESVVELLHRTAGRNGFTAHSGDYLRAAARALGPTENCTAYTSTVDGTVVSALLTYDSPTTRIFAHSGMDAAVRKLRPNQPLIAQAMLDAAERGLAVADLFGIAPPNEPEHPWTGFSAFKRSFGGADVALGGTWDVPVSLPRYNAYRALRTARDTASTARSRVRTVVQERVRAARGGTAQQN